MNRIDHPKMAWYREVYKNSRRWMRQGQSLEGKTVIVYCEQGFGDVIQMARYFKPLKEKNCKVIAHCDPLLKSLLLSVDGVDEVLEKSTEDYQELPEHDFHILSLGFPFVLGDFNAEYPYIFSEETLELPFDKKDGCIIGIAWEGNPEQENNAARSCPLQLIANRFPAPYKLVMLSPKIHSLELAKGIDDIELYGTGISDFTDTAKVINAVDFVVSVDTGVLHLAGAMGKETYGLLCFSHCDRWTVRNWYPSMRLYKQGTPGCWEKLLERLPV